MRLVTAAEAGVMLGKTARHVYQLIERCLLRWVPGEARYIPGQKPQRVLEAAAVEAYAAAPVVARRHPWKGRAVVPKAER